MSCHYGYRCRQCGPEKDSFTWLNHGKDRLFDLLDVRPEIYKVYSVIDEMKIDGVHDYPDPVAWLVEYKGHKGVCVIDEYGETFEPPRQIKHQNASNLSGQGA